jgi:putative copper resistance protein D
MWPAPPGVGLWTPDLFVSANLVLLTCLYLWAVRRAGSRLGSPWPRLRTVAFLAAMVLLAVAYLGPFTTWAHVMFWPHMAQHLVVMMVAAPLIVLSSPVRLTFLCLGDTGRRRFVRVMRSAPAAVLTNPYVTWLLFAGVLLGVHVTPVMQWVITDHDAMNFVERPLYLAVSLLFYYPLIGTDLIARRPAPGLRLLSLGLMMIPETVLGMVIHFAPVPLYPAYVESGAALGFDPLADQKFSGAMMWAIAMVLDGFWMMVAALEWWRDQETLTRKLERSEARALLEQGHEDSAGCAATETAGPRPDRLRS